MSYLQREYWTVGCSVLGAALWAVIATLAGAGKAPMGVIELLFLFAPLVVVPLGLQLAHTVSPTRLTVLDQVIVLAQPIAAACAVLSFWLPQGTLAAALVLPWLLLCLLIGLCGATDLFNRRSALAARIASIARLDLVLAGGWLLVSRYAGHPMGFREPIVLLTAIHFHYSGFATGLLAAAGLQLAERKSMARREWRTITIATALLPFVLAAGFVFSRLLRVAAACAFSLTVAALAALIFLEARWFRNWNARIFVRLSSASVGVGMTLAVLYAISDYLHRDWLIVPQMARTHGVLNAFGFVMIGLLGWLIESHPTTSEEEHENRNHRGNRLRGASFSAGTAGARTQRDPVGAWSGPARAGNPEFAAREFYER
jgi:YndJ-like protein